MSYVPAPRLIAYAGQTERPKPRGLSAYSMFRFGYNTLEIANHLGVTEAEALRRINRSRSKKLGLPDPYRKGEA